VAIGDIMGLETFALINDQNQVVNHIVIDKEDSNFESNMAGQLEYWGCVRYVETTEEEPVIILDESPTIWTTHTEEDGFVLPEGINGTIEVAFDVISEPDPEISSRPKVTINGKTYPADSLLIKENAAKRPAGWALPDDAVEVSLSDAE
jgi:hypothetical protein